MTEVTTELPIEAANEDVTQQQIDQATLEQKLTALKGLDLSQAVVNVYAVKTSTTNKKKRFQSVKQIPCSADLEGKFRGYIQSCIAGHEHIAELRDINTSQDNRFFYVESAATDFSQIVELVGAEDIPGLTAASDLNVFNGYVIKLTVLREEEETINLYAFRYLSKAWSVRNTATRALSFKVLQNELVADLNTEPSFSISSKIDMIQVGEGVFIADIGQFESAMNYRARLAQKKEEAIAVLDASPALVQGAGDALSRAIGQDKHLMRQLASVHSKGYYNNDVWLTQLHQAAQGQGWLVEFDDNGKIVVQEDKAYVQELLTLLQNKRVRTVVDGVIFDVDGELIDLPVAN